ncbi:MAG: MBL fold metallo-hydrolase [Paludibacteraceae bacterium]|nr:MBL fold metallo-hydrolase [Paludibacteraceae bacterium]
MIRTLSLFEPEPLRFMSLTSGSCGNCYYIGTTVEGILIDAGIGARTIRKRLKKAGVDFDTILGVFITHDHSDHIKGVGGLGEKMGKPIFSTIGVLSHINENLTVQPKLSTASRREIRKNETISIGNFSVTAFNVIHDGHDNMGYRVEYEGDVIVIATDLGDITDEVSRHLMQAQHIVIESNYDDEMLMNGPYPQTLKNRISTGNGHLSNRKASEWMRKHWTPQMKDVFLCHLSAQNNTPELAYNSMSNALEQAGAKEGETVRLKVLPRRMETDLMIL